jgi:uronate dehydrogenase
VNKPKIAITGPAGRVGSRIVPLLRNEYQLVLIDSKKIKPEQDDVIFTGDIRDINFLKTSLIDCEAVIHLAAIPDDDDVYTKLIPYNIEAVYTLFETCRNLGIKKIIFASTAQTVLHYPNSIYIKTDMPPRPYTIYACTKLFGESLARFYSDKFGISIICLRIGWFQDYDSEYLTDTEIKKRWCSPKDLTQIICKSIKSQLKFGVFFAISNNKDRYWDIESAKNLLGYEPVDGA